MVRLRGDRITVETVRRTDFVVYGLTWFSSWCLSVEYLSLREGLGELCRKFALRRVINCPMSRPGVPILSTGLMAELRGGNPEAAGRLVEFFYPELRRLVSARMLGELSNHT